MYIIAPRATVSAVVLKAMLTNIIIENCADGMDKESITSLDGCATNNPKYEGEVVGVICDVKF
jgi:hypothetical protein